DNASLSARELQRHVIVDEDSMDLLEEAIDDHGLSTRAINRVLKISRTIADLDNRTDVTLKDIEEALSFRLVDRE
ncbi:hypothetical protein KAI87_11795, partial [Myxococcota bacterium]|nr:hypothetical protein [Myxococcota bacterium]